MSGGGQRRVPVPSVAAAALALLAVSVSAADAPALVLDGERPAVVGLALGAPRERVLETLLAAGAPAPDCAWFKLAPRRGRNAFPLLRCEHAPPPAAPCRLADHRVETLVSHFVDGQLVRLDARLVAGGGEREAGAPSPRVWLERRLGAPDGNGTRAALRWTRGEDRVELRARARSGALELVLIDDVVANALPSLETFAPPTRPERR